MCADMQVIDQNLQLVDAFFFAGGYEQALMRHLVQRCARKECEGIYVPASPVM